MIVNLRSSDSLSRSDRYALELAHDGPVPSGAAAPVFFATGYESMSVDQLHGWLRVARENIRCASRALQNSRRRLRQARIAGRGDIFDQFTMTRRLHADLRAARAEMRPLLAEISRRAI